MAPGIWMRRYFNGDIAISGDSLPEDLYERILRICNLVANYSDSQAILLHKKIKGIDLN